jgi:acetyl esterase/lipase
MTLARKFILALLAAATLLVALVACAPLRAINVLTAGDSYRKTGDVIYGSDPRQRLDVYSPWRRRSGGLAPVVVFFYGGNWTSGNRGDYAFVGEALASRGIVAVIADLSIRRSAIRAFSKTAREPCRGPPTRCNHTAATPSVCT